jgi:hypothetical protein
MNQPSAGASPFRPYLKNRLIWAGITGFFAVTNLVDFSVNRQLDDLASAAGLLMFSVSAFLAPILPNHMGAERRTATVGPLWLPTALLIAGSVFVIGSIALKFFFIA